jgi:ParB family chromosome partitioning protein
MAEDVRAEGWAWVEAVPHLTYAERQAFQNAPRQRREPTKREARRIASLQTRLDKIDAELEEACDAEDEDKAEKLEQRREGEAGELQAAGGCLAGLRPRSARRGRCHRHHRPQRRGRDSSRPAARGRGQGAAHAGKAAAAVSAARRRSRQRRRRRGRRRRAQGREPVRPAGAAVERPPHRRAANRSRPASASRAGRAGAWHGADRLAGRHYGHDLPLGVRLTVQDRLEGMAPDWPESPAAVALRELQQVAGEALPEDSAELFAALLAKSQDELVRLLAVCVASTVDVVTPRATPHQPGEELAQAVGLDMAAWWKPTAEGYFKHVSKAVILDAVGEFAPEHVTRLAKLKKADIASEAERLADGTGWMPAIFKAEGPQDAAQEEGPEQDAPEDAEAMADEPAEALAA